MMAAHGPGASLGRLATIKTFLQYPPAVLDLGDEGRDLRGSPVTPPGGSGHEEPPSPEVLGAALQAFYLRDVEMLQVCHGPVKPRQQLALILVNRACWGGVAGAGAAPSLACAEAYMAC